MSDILIIPDVHGRTFWKEPVKNEEFDHIVFLGDYLDPYPQEGITQRQAFENFKEPLNNTLINDAKIELIGNTTATTLWRADDIFDELRYQLIEPVKWFESMELLYDQEDIHNYIEIGPKPVLAKLIKMTHSDVNVITVSGE